ncbi:MAG: hypothetical protein COV59_00330 [Candidatus Magasanikbacteria bacterium CG11_big_fil_rev_8_21_14_0_20_39_34]|uniref:DoxX family protein n=1 Tax=Candidatus Magasanikbacteria bacterium CG11_big_fil_rev_8_21_14_0_20_39_34 TaxID=1974653 RepID=A0A2H0N6P6_9BACT|nr:MAG: hypothetical protein COV59_00330 [Candidatus Magasanikbacteria bacterium CG11_big_fil_rev_8_21_14_0_20_39_34]
MKGKCSSFAGKGLFLLRLFVGIIFVSHGWDKLHDLDMTSQAFTAMGIFAPGAMGVLTGIIELLGGLALILGVFTCAASTLLALVMLGAILMVHLKNGLSMMNGGFEYPLALLGACLAILDAGPGKWALCPDKCGSWSKKKGGCCDEKKEKKGCCGGGSCGSGEKM